MVLALQFLRARSPLQTELFDAWTKFSDLCCCETKYSLYLSLNMSELLSITMSDKLIKKYPHLSFIKNWELSPKSMFLLGQCQAFVQAISNAGILPQYYSELMNLSLTKGAQATTAIEGNSLSIEEVNQIRRGDSLPPSKDYQEKEVKNILEAYNDILDRVVNYKQTELITPSSLKRYHRIIGKSLGKYFDAIPGQFRNDNRIVGTYRCPDHQDVDDLIDRYCNWMKKEFHYDRGQEFYEYVIQAIVAHVYLEWIHPFGDGNGRLGRLVELYILLRGGIPNIASHILSNYYNMTRPQYYAELSEATEKISLTSFIEYALLGFRDGLEQTLKTIQKSQLEITWQKFVYDQFSSQKMGQKEVFKRRRRLALEMPYDRWLTREELVFINPQVASNYRNVSEKTIDRDIKILLDLNLIEFDRENQRYRSMISQLTTLLAQKV